PRHVRFHDLRHTTVTLLLKDGVSLAVAQKVARHSDPKLTAEIYGHLELGDLAGRWSAWTSAPPPYPRRRLCPRSPPSRSLSAPSPVLRVDCGAASREKLRPQHRRKRQRCCGPMKSGRLDLNQRPLAPEASALPGCATPRHGPTGAASQHPLPRASTLQADLLSAFFRTCEGRNVSTRRAEISISCPVCGLRPTRDFFSRTTKLPNPESLIFSPRSSVSFSVSKTISTISADSFLENPTLPQTLSMTSALVMARQYTDSANSVKPRRKRPSLTRMTQRISAARRSPREASPGPLC